MDGIKVTGIWKVVENNITSNGYGLDYPSKYTFDLTQKSNKVWGTAVAFFTNKDNCEDQFDYKVKGRIKDGFLSLILDIQQNKISPIIFLLKVVDGNRMEGLMTFYAQYANEINSVKTHCILSV